MDLVDAMRTFVAVVAEGSLAGAARKLDKSPAAVTRAVAFLERHIGAALIHRSTRSLRLSPAGEDYAVACRRIVMELEEAELAARNEQVAPRGTLTITAPVAAGEDVVRPLADAFMDAHPAVAVRLLLLDRPSNLIDERIDVALRIGHLPDSSLVAVGVGSVRTVVVAAPGYLAAHGPLADPSDLARHRIIAMTHFGSDSWAFAPAPGTSHARRVALEPRLTVNSIRAAVASAVEGRGVTRMFSYHVARELADGRLQTVLDAHEPPPVSVSVVTPPERLSVPKVRAFVDFALPKWRGVFARP